MPGGEKTGQNSWDEGFTGDQAGPGRDPAGGARPAPQSSGSAWGTQAEPEGQGCGRTPHTEPALREEKCAGRIMSAGHSGEEKWGAVHL